MSGFSPTALVLVATLGNVIGSLTNYALGYWTSLGYIQRWFKVSNAEFSQAEERFKKWGLASLLLAWVPIIGDPLTVLAGILRIRLLWFVLFVSIGKFLRYLFIAFVTLQVN